MKHNKYLLLLPLVALTSCGYSLNYIVEGNKYNSPIFQENYYRHWDDELKNAKEDLNVVLDNSNPDKPEYITSFSGLTRYDPNVLLNDYSSADAYGEDYRMNNVDDMFNYGIQSKLFDGQVQCLQRYQLARVQIDDQGFSMRYSKEGDGLKYFAMQFRATTDNTVTCYTVGGDELARHSDTDLFHNSIVDLHVGLYTKNDNNEIIKNTFTAKIILDNNNTNRGSHYVFLAFDLQQFNLSRLVGTSFEYDVNDELVEYNKERGVTIDYSLMLYEVFFPYTSWH